MQVYLSFRDNHSHAAQSDQSSPENEAVQTGSGVYGSDVDTGAEHFPDQSTLVLRSTRWRHRRWRWALYLAIPLFIIAITASGGYWYLDNRLASGPVELPKLGPRIATAMSARVGGGYRFLFGKAQLQKEQGRPSIVINQVSLTGRDNVVILSAPKAIVSLDWLALATGRVKTKRLAVVGLDLHVAVAADGTLGITAGAAEVALAKRAGASSGIDARRGSLPRNSPYPVDAKGDAGRTVVRLLGALFKQLGAEQALSSLRHIGITRGKLILSDPSLGRRTVFHGLEMDVAHSPDKLSIDVSANGSRGRWRVVGSATRSGGFNVTARAENITLNEILPAAGTRHASVDFDNKLDAEVFFQFDEAGTIRAASGKLVAGPGLLVLPDRDFEPLQIDNAAAVFRWNAKAQHFSVPEFRYKAGASEVAFKGSVSPPRTGRAGWRIEMNSSGPARLTDQMRRGGHVRVEKISLALRVEPARRRVTIERFGIDSGDVDLLLSGTYAYARDERYLTVTGQVDRAPVGAVLSLWPPMVAAPARSWFRRNVSGGTLEKLKVRVNFDDAALRALVRNDPLPETSTDIEYALSGVTLRYMPGAKPLTAVRARGRTRGPVSEITIDRAVARFADGRKMHLSSGKFRLRDLGQDVLAASLRFSMAGTLAGLSELLAQPALSQYAPQGIELDDMRGKLAADMSLTFRTGRPVKDPGLKLSARARISNLHVEKFAAGAPLEDAKLDVTLRNGALMARGAGRLKSIPVGLKIDKPRGGDPVALLNLVLDDKARAKFGWDSGGIVTGPVKVAVNTSLARKDRNSVKVSLDLTRAAIGNVAPMLAKRAGASAQLAFSLVQGGSGVVLKDAVYRSASLSARGTVMLDRNNGLLGARLSRLKFSPGDDLRAKINKTGGAMKVAITGAAIDLRPFFNTQSGAAPGRGAKQQHSLDLSIRTRIASGFNGHVLSGFALEMSKKGERVSKFSLAARAGKTPVSGRLLSSGADGPVVEIVSGNEAGTILAFLNVYKRMVGGRLRLRAKIASAGMSGDLYVRKFILRNEKALWQLVAQGGPPSADSRRRRINPTAVAFEKLHFGFQRTSRVLVIKDGVLSGPEIGLTIAGRVDWGNNRVAMKGTFVPLYGLNNVFARIPLFGPLLGGGRNEGLLGLNFSVSGRVDQPVLNINPLSAIAPGFLRKIFGALPAERSR